MAAALALALSFIRLTAPATDDDRTGDYLATGADFTYRIRRDVNCWGDTLGTWTLYVESGSITIDSIQVDTKGFAVQVAEAHERIAHTLNSRGRDTFGNDRMMVALEVALEA